MAVFDWSKAEREKEELKSYERLKEHLASKDKDGYVNNFFLAINHIERMERKIEEQEKELNEYRAFFSTMSKFLPKEFSKFDIIG